MVKMNIRLVCALLAGFFCVGLLPAWSYGNSVTNYNIDGVEGVRWGLLWNERLSMAAGFTLTLNAGFGDNWSPQTSTRVPQLLEQCKRYRLRIFAVRNLMDGSVERTRLGQLWARVRNNPLFKSKRLNIPADLDLDPERDFLLGLLKGRSCNPAATLDNYFEVGVWIGD
jgi:hypothetical protein